MRIGARKVCFRVGGRHRNSAQHRKHGEGNESGKPDREPGSGALRGKQTHRQREQRGQRYTFRQAVKHSIERQGRDRIPIQQRGHHHCSPPFGPAGSVEPNSSRKRLSPSASMLWSSSRSSISSSCESLKKRLSRLRTSDRVASLRPTRGSYTWARPSFKCLT